MPNNEVVEVIEAAAAARGHVVEVAAARAALRTGRVAAVRVKAGLSQAEMAKGMGVARTTLQAWEAGRRSPRGPAAQRLASLIDILERIGSAS